jgi:hypothetical protein
MKEQNNQQKFESFLQSVLKGRDSCETGSQLCKSLMTKFGISSNYASKIIGRAVSNKKLLWSHPIAFGHRQYLYWKPGSLLTPQNVAIACQEDRPPIYRLLTSMIAQGGGISLFDAYKITGSHIRSVNAKHSRLHSLLNGLENLKLIKQIKGVESDEAYIVFSSPSVEENGPQKHLLTSMKLSATFLPDLLNLLKRNNLLDSRQIVYRNKSNPHRLVEHADHVWDSFGYTKTTGINTVLGNNSSSNNKKCLVVIDVVIDRIYGHIDLDGFIERIQSVRNSPQKGTRKILPIVCYASLENEVSARLRSYGFLTYDMGTVYGSKIFEMIKSIGRIKELTLSADKVSPDVPSLIDATLHQIRSCGQDVNLSNIKGDLLEALLFPLFNRLYPNASILQKKTIQTKDDENKKKEFEYDFIMIDHSMNEIVIVEVKGRKANHQVEWGDEKTKNTLGWFFNGAVPFAKSYYKKNPIQSGMSVRACFISTGHFNDNTIARLSEFESSKLRPTKMKISYKRDELFQLLNDNGLDKTVQTIERYFE